MCTAYTPVKNEVKWPLLDEWFEARAMSLAVISIL